MKKVNIILATYNGSKGIEKQLDSIMAQTYPNITIYIRDDGSNDNTVELIEAYKNNQQCKYPIVLLDNGGVNLKCPGSFYEIVKRCEPADYYSFCDQDDVWYPEKIARAVERLEKENKDQVLVYYSACDYKTPEGEFIRKSPEQKEKIELLDVMYYTPGSGFTIVFNEKARQELLLKKNPGRELHDRWILRGAACIGKAIYDKESTAAHIRHEDAVTASDADNKSLLKGFIQDELMGDDVIHDKENLVYFYQEFQNELDSEQKKVLELFTRKNNPLIWVKKVFYPRRLRVRLPGELALRLLFFVGKV